MKNKNIDLDVICKDLKLVKIESLHKRLLKVGIEQVSDKDIAKAVIALCGEDTKVYVITDNERVNNVVYKVSSKFIDVRQYNQEVALNRMLDNIFESENTAKEKLSSMRENEVLRLPKGISIMAGGANNFNGRISNKEIAAYVEVMTMGMGE